MSYELVLADWAGGRLHGLLSHPSASERVGLAIHVHGTWGNFYGNDVVAELGRVYNEHGYSFLAANFSGHDENSIYEEFETFPASLVAWLDAVPVQGRLILQGHSLGALKILYLASSGRLKSIDPHAIFMLSVFDSVGFYERETRVNETLHAYLKTLVESAGDRVIVPETAFPHWQISASTLRAATTERGSWDQFPSRLGAVGALEALSVPTAVLIGSEDFASVPDPYAVSDLLGSMRHLRSALIDGAPHNFAGKEAEAARFLTEWLSAVG